MISSYLLSIVLEKRRQVFDLLTLAIDLSFDESHVDLVFISYLCYVLNEYLIEKVWILYQHFQF